VDGPSDDRRRNEEQDVNKNNGLETTRAQARMKEKRA
jgi:hypothetical protein